MREGKIALPAVLAIDSEYSVALAVQGSSPKPAPKRTALIDVRPKFLYVFIHPSTSGLNSAFSTPRSWRSLLLGAW
jgi:hypothetical protein